MTTTQMDLDKLYPVETIAAAAGISPETVGALTAEDVNYISLTDAVYLQGEETYPADVWGELLEYLDDAWIAERAAEILTKIEGR